MTKDYICRIGGLFRMVSLSFAACTSYRYHLQTNVCESFLTIPVQSSDTATLFNRM